VQRCGSIAVIAISLALTVSQTSCSAERPVGAAALDLPTVNSQWLIGEPAPYSGELREGTYVVCTSRFSEEGVYDYAVSGDGSVEKIASMVSMHPGECVVVAQAKKNPRKAAEAAVTVTPFVGRPVTFVARIDSGCSANCLISVTSAYSLGGSAGAILKLYFTSGSVEDSGNHGGTGTLTFSED